MAKSSTIQPIDRDTYDNLWTKWKGSILQSWNWGEVKSSNWKVERVGIYTMDQPIGVVTIYYSHLPGNKILQNFMASSFAYIPRGFTLADNNLFSTALQGLHNYFAAKKVGFVLLDPEYNLFAEHWNESFKNTLEEVGWKVSGETIQPNQTDVVKIDKNATELLAAMNPKWRRNIKKAEKHGVDVRKITEKKDIALFHKVLTITSKKNKFGIHPLAYFEKIWEHMVLNEQGSFYLSTYKNEVVAAYMLLESSTVASEIYGGVTKRGRNIEASYLIKYRMMEEVGKKGKIYYDQWGVAPLNEKNHPLAGVSYFKQGFGGNYTQFLRQYVLIYNRPLFALYQLLRKFH